MEFNYHKLLNNLLIFVLCYVSLYIAAIKMSFRQSSYSVSEDVGVVTPMLSIDKPSPCCLTVYAELINKTAKG